MRNITFSSSYQRILTIVSVIALLFSSALLATESISSWSSSEAIYDMPVFKSLEEANYEASFIGPKLPLNEVKGVYASQSNSYKFETVSSINDMAEFTNCNVAVDCECHRTVTNTEHCSSGTHYQMYVAGPGGSKTLNTVGTSVWEECSSTGTARFHGQSSKNGETFTWDVYFSGATTTPPSQSPKKHDCLNENSNGWVYYPDACGTLTSSVNGTFDLTRMGPSFQLGNGANVTSDNLDFGGSGWFTITGGNGAYTSGDLNLMLSNNVTCPTNSTGATNDTNSTFRGVPVSGNVLTNDVDPQGDNQFVATTPVSGPSHGSVSLNVDGTYTYTPTGSYMGTDSFVYEVCDDGSPKACARATVTIQILASPTPRSCECSPFYENSNFVNPTKISGSHLQEGAVYRFRNVFPGNQYGTTIDALVKIEDFNNGASLLEIDVTSSGLQEAFQPRINSTNNGDQSVEFSITFVEDGGGYNDQVTISFFASPLDIDGDNVSTREYGEISLPDAYFVSNNTVLTMTQNATLVRGECSIINVAPGPDVSLDPRFTYSNYFENKSTFNYTIGKVAGDSDRYYSLDMDSADYNDPNSVLVTYPVICGNVSDDNGFPLENVEIDVTGSDGSSTTVTTDNNGNYKAIATIPEALVNVDYDIRENDLNGYLSISDVDGANDNLIERTINLMSTCGNDFVDGADSPDGWSFDCGDDKVVDEFGYNANCQNTSVVDLSAATGIYQYVAELVFKGGNPGQTLDVIDSSGTAHTLARDVPLGNSSNVFVYRGLITGSTTSLTYTTTNTYKCKLQSIVVYAFRNEPGATASTGVFTGKSGYNNIQTITIDVPSFTGPRDLIIETPISELTPDGRYLLLKAQAGPVSDQLFIYGPDGSLPGGDCCLAVPSLTLTAVPGNVTQVTITIDTRNGQNGQSVNGQSWVIASGVNIEGVCYDELELTLDNQENILCFGDDTGSITVTPTGGLPPYSFTLNGGTPQASPIFSNLTAGVYNVEVTDSLSNTASISVTLTEPDPINIQLSKVDATATAGCMNGQATATPSGGVGPYTYLWGASAGNQTTQTATNLQGSAGGGITHIVTVTDANGCTSEQSVVIDCVNDCDAVITIDSVTDVLCKDDESGSATVSASSMANPGAAFTFTWNTTPPQVDSGVTSSTVSGLGAGVYTVSVTIDGTLCAPVQQSVTIVEPATSVNVTATSTDESGPGAGDGTATANPSGGTPPYSYQWSPGGATTQTITGLGAGTYAVTVTDANGCMATATTTVNSIPCNLSATASSTPVSCNSGNDGTATVGVSGGVGPFTYAWSPGGQTTQSITGLVAGVYTVTVTDTTTLCVETSTTTVNQPGALSSGIAITSVDCYGEPTGSLDLTVTGGTQPYTFLWSPGGATTEDITNVPAGTYSVLITDANGCTLNDSATVAQPQAALTLAIDTQTDIVCSGDGSVTVLASGGTAPYLYSLDGGIPQATGTFDNLAPGAYVISALDANGCTAEIDVEILKNCTDAINDINNTYMDIAVSGNVLTNDEDAEGDTQTVTTTGTFPTVQGGSVTMNADGSYIYTPPAGYVGPDQFNYSIVDSGNPQATDSATVFIQVLPIVNNNTTIANADTAGTLVDTPVDGNVLTNDLDPEGDNQTVTSVGTFPTTQGGSITINADGSYTYTPPAGFVGEDTFEYFITDDNPNGPATDSAILAITVSPNNGTNVTFANDDAYNGNQGATVSGNVLDNDQDPEGHTQLVDTVLTPVSGPSFGVLSINADGTFTYTPNDPNFFGTDQFVYEIFDNGSPVARDQATVIITIFGINTTDAINDINNTYMDIAVSGNVLTNDEDAEGDTQTVTTTGTFPTVQGGSVTMNADGSYIYTPPAGYVGPDQFNYSIVDSGNPQATDSATVFIQVLPIVNNNTTIANADTAGTLMDTPVDGNVLTNDFDPEGDNQTVTSVGTFPTTQGGSITINADGSYTYTPPAGFVGEDTFEYFITDDNPNGPATDSAILAITVSPNNGTNVTFANDDAYNGNQGATVSGNVLDNDQDPEGHTQLVDTVLTPVSGSNFGVLSINADGTFTYTPNDPNFFGTDQFVYEIFDNGSPVARDQATVIITIFGINTTDAINDINNTYMDIAVSGNVLTNDEDAEGDTQTVTTTGTFPTVQGGSVTMNADGSYIYTSPAGYVGPDQFNYSIVDSGNPQATDSATVFIQVLPIVNNNTTIANADTAGTLMDTPVDGNVLTNDFDPEGDNQTVTSVGTFPTTQGGSITINADGSYTYTPSAGFVGEDAFEYFITDDNPNGPATDSAILAITVSPNNGTNVTFANDDAYNGNQGATVSGNVLDNDQDPEGHTQLVDTVLTPVSGPSFGLLSINADGTFTYTPNDPNFFGTDQFVYEIFDNGSPVARDQATVIITIFGMNLTDAVQDINNTYVDLLVSGNVLTNDEDAEGDAQVVTSVGTFPTTQGGSITINADGSYTYSPPAGFTGQDTFEYTIEDDGNPQATDSAIIYIEVLPINSSDNDPPVANPDTAGTEIDTPVDGNVLPNDFDPDGDTIMVTSVGTFPTTEGGTVTINADGTFTYTPPAGFTGEDTFPYTICDDAPVSLCDDSFVTITVDGNNLDNHTYANDDAYNGIPGQTIFGNVLDNDQDPEGDIQTVISTRAMNPQNGALTMNPNGTFTYVPNDPEFVGTDQFIYSICDSGTPQACDEATVYLTIGDPGNDILAIDDINNTYVGLSVDGNVGTNDENPDGPAGTEVYTLVSGPADGGTLLFNADGTYTYTPPADPMVMEDTFVYQICDAGNPIACDTATVYIEILPLGSPDNNPPVANADTNTTEVNTPIDGNVLPNDFDPDGDDITITTPTVTTAEGVVVTINPDGSYIYTPPFDFEGEDTFEYSICDNGTPQLCDTTTVIIQVIPNKGNITVANDDAYNGFIDVDITGNVLDNDEDPEGDGQMVDATISPISGPSNGTLVINADGTFIYTPNAGFFGTDQFVYEIFDDNATEARDQATAYLTIGDPGNDILAIDDINNTFVNTSIDGNVGTNDINPDGPAGTETFTLVSGPTAGGTLVFNPDGTYTYTPTLDFVGEDTFVYQVCDAGNPIACDTAIVTIEVVDDPIIGNDPPIANNDTNVTLMNVPVDGNVLPNDYDPDGDLITITTPSVTTAEGVVVTINPDGSYTYNPPIGFVGEDTFVYSICDNGTPSLCDDATVVIYVLPGGKNITAAVDDAYYGEVNALIMGNVLDNDSDPQNDNQTVDIAISPVSGPSNGTLVINADGTFTYTPDPGFIGTDQFVYAIFDDGFPVATDLATVYILIEQTPAPAIAILKTGVFVDGNQNQCADAGESIDYTMTVTNEGNMPLANIIVTDPLLGGVIPGPDSGDTNSDDILDLDETWIYLRSYTITQDDIDAGQVVNQASAEGTDEDGTTVEDLSDETSILEDDPTITVLCQNPAIAIVKAGFFVDGNGNQCADVGESIDYTFIVTNQGNVSLGSIIVDDPLLGGPIAGPDSGDTDGDLELDVTETWMYTASYIITQDDIDDGQVVNQATADGTAPDGTIIDDLSDDDSILEDDPTVTELCQNPAIAIVKTGLFVDGNGDNCADVDETIDYTFTVTNQGNLSLASIVVDDPFLGGVIPGPDSGDTDGDLELDVTETWTYLATYTITQVDIDAGQVENQATADGTAPDGTVVDDLSDDDSILEDDPTVTELCQNPAIAIVKTGLFVDGNGNNCADVDETIDYTFTVTNQGNVSLASIVVDDPFLGGVIPGPDSGDTDGDLELDVTETWTYLATYTITQVDIDAGQVVNQATADGTAPNGTVVDDLSDDDSILEDDPTITELCQEASIALIKFGIVPDPVTGGGCPVEGDIIEYEFTVVNTGNVTLNNVFITDALPGIVLLGGPITLAAGATDATTFTATYPVTQADVDAGQVINQAEVFGTTQGGTTVTDLSDDNVITEDDPTIVDLCQTPVIALVKKGTFNDENGDECADLGETISYEFTVFNLGNVTLENITINDPIVNVIGGPITLAPLASDATSFTATYIITQDDIDMGSRENQATVTGFTLLGQEVNDLSDESSEFGDDPTITDLCQGAQIALVKMATPNDENGNGCIDVDETIDYSFIVTNTGNVTLTGVFIMDGLVNVQGSPITLMAGESDISNFFATYTVVQSDIDAGNVTNQAIAEGTTPDGTVVSDLSDFSSNTEDRPTVTILCQEPKMSVEKSGVWNDDNGDGAAQEGETVSYVFNVTNTGNVTLYNIELEDPLPGLQLMGGPIAVLNIGDTDMTTFTAEYTITQEDVDAGEVLNQAIATAYDNNGAIIATDTSDDPNNPVNTDIDGDGDPDDVTVTILPNVLNPGQFEIFNGITPDSDGLNDFFNVLGIENWPNNNMKIFNRWGVLVWETDGYGGATGKENVFTGISNGRSTIREEEALPTGTYFYILERVDADSGETLKNSGYLYINR